MTTAKQLETLRKVAYAADDAYSAELVRVYGSSACNARYRWSHADARVEAAAQRKIAADHAYRIARIANGEIC